MRDDLAPDLALDDLPLAALGKLAAFVRGACGQRSEPSRVVSSCSIAANTVATRATSLERRAVLIDWHAAAIVELEPSRGPGKTAAEQLRRARDHRVALFARGR